MLLLNKKSSMIWPLVLVFALTQRLERALKFPTTKNGSGSCSIRCFKSEMNILGCGSKHMQDLESF